MEGVMIKREALMQLKEECMAKKFISALWVPVLAMLLAAGAADGQFPGIRATFLVQGFSQPLHVTHAGDGSGRIFVVEKEGRIKTIRNGSVVITPFLDIAARVNQLGEGGLLSVAFPPANTPNRGYFYVYYTDLSGNIQISRFLISANPDLADATSEVGILTIPHPVFSNHYGGQLAFGPDGFLYAGTGDGGGGGDPFSNAQNPLSFLGKMLRLDVETAGCVVQPPPPSGLNYCIPPGNPFIGTPGVLAELWALGLRNPFRFSFDRTTGDLYIGDVGQSSREEVNFQAAVSTGGQNYGWNIMEGSICFSPAQGCVLPPAFVPPVAEYDHSLGCSVTGGHVYRGPNAALAGLQGVYLYGDFCSGRIWGLRNPGGPVENAVVFSSEFSITSFGEDEAGNIYLTDFFTGRIFRIDAVPVTTTRIGVYSVNTWFLDLNGTGAWEGLPEDATRFFGFPGAVPVAGDWTGDGISKIGVYANGFWYLDSNNNGVWDGEPSDRIAYYGFPGAIPVVGNWNNTLTDKLGVYANGFWYLDINGNFGWDGEPTDRIAHYGFAGSVPVAGDWTGNGTDRLGVYADGFWYLDINGNFAWDGEPTDRIANFGFAGSVPAVGDWNGSGTTKLGVYADGFWYLDLNGSFVWNGEPVDQRAHYGFAGAIPVVIP